MSKAIIAASEDEVAKEMAKAAEEVDRDLSPGEDDVGNDLEAETKVGGVSRETHSQWSNATLA